MPHIFLSYSRKDSDYALQFAGELRARGAKLWMDTASLTAAETWSAEIVSAIRECSTFMVLLSPSAVSSQNVTKELLLASELLKPIVPIELEECQMSDAMTYALAGLHRISAKDEDSLTRWLVKFGITDDSSKPLSLAKLPNSHDIRRLAILPFEDLSPAKDNDWFADGMTDELIGTLSSLQKLHVNPRNDVMYYKGKQPKLSEVAADLGVRYVAVGSVQKIGEKIRIRVSLSDALTHQQLWAEKYDGTFDDIFDFEDKTARSISDALRLKLTPEEEKKIDERPTNNPDAYELYLKAHSLYQKKTRADFEESYRLHEAAIALDPNFSEAYASLAITCAEYCRLYGHKDVWLARAENSARKVYEFDGESARTFLIMSMLDRLHGNVESSLAHASRAVELDSNLSQAYNILGWAYLSLGRIEEAANVLEKGLLLSINEPSIHFNLLIVLIGNQFPGRLEAAAKRAVPVYEKYLLKYPDNFNTAVQFVVILEVLSRREEAITRAEALLENDRLDGNALYNLGCFYCSVESPQRGIEIIRKSLQRGYASVEDIKRNAFFKEIEKLPEFQDLLKIAEKEKV